MFFIDELHLNFRDEEKQELQKSMTRQTYPKMKPLSPLLQLALLMRRNKRAYLTILRNPEEYTDVIFDMCTICSFICCWNTLSHAPKVNCLIIISCIYKLIVLEEVFFSFLRDYTTLLSSSYEEQWSNCTPGRSYLASPSNTNSVNYQPFSSPTVVQITV